MSRTFEIHAPFMTLEANEKSNSIFQDYFSPLEIDWKARSPARPTPRAMQYAKGLHKASPPDICETGSHYGEIPRSLNARRVSGRALRA